MNTNEECFNSVVHRRRNTALINSMISSETKTVLPPMKQDGDNEEQLAVTHPPSDDMIPDELLFALTQPIVPDKPTRTLKPHYRKPDETLNAILKKGKPANVWNHQTRRNKFKHLTDFPRSSFKQVGTRDVSFLYDVKVGEAGNLSKHEHNDRSAVRLEAIPGDTLSKSKLALPNTVIPEEYHLVKSKAVLGLEMVDEDLTTKLVDADQTLRVFPSLNPTKRFEVVQLLQTLDLMLEKSGCDDDAEEVKGPTQIHNLLELIKKEQKIYDLVFAELIRQVSIGCVERGQLLAKLRYKYAELINRIPRQIKSLHAEVMAQRSLDRRLTEELTKFKSSITYLTTELQEVKSHDSQVTQDAQKAEVELAKALKESQTNANLVDEYHDLYELQRHRLEDNVQTLSKERDTWSNAAYSMALKIMSLNSLSSAKRLHVCEKSWAKLASYFAVLLNDNDSGYLSKLQQHVEKWRSLIFLFMQKLETADKNTRTSLNTVLHGIEEYVIMFNAMIQKQPETGSRTFLHTPDHLVPELSESFKKWEELISKDGERFGGDMLLSNQETLNEMKREVLAWTDMALTVYRRHKPEQQDIHPLSNIMNEIGELLHDLTKQLQVRVSGENGVARGMISLQNGLDQWSNKLVILSASNDSLNNAEWLQLNDRLQEYINMVSETLKCVGSQQRDEDRSRNVDHQDIDASETMKEVQNWMKTTLNQIEGEDGKLIAQASSLHTDMVFWMVQCLLHIAPNFEELDSDLPTSSLLIVCSVEDLVSKAQDITNHISTFTSYLSQCCNTIVTESMLEKRAEGHDDAEHEYKDFIRLKKEAVEWITTAQIVLNCDKFSHVHDNIVLLTDAVKAKLAVPKDAKSDDPPATAESQLTTSRSSTQDDMKNKEVSKPADVVKSDEAEATPAPTAAEEIVVEAEPVPTEAVAKTETSEQEAQEESALPSSISVLGTDDNVHSASLENVSEGISPPRSAVTGAAYDAIAKMDQLQQELLETEKRAQLSEVKANELEQELIQSNEEIRSLKRRIAALESGGADSADLKSDKDPKSGTATPVKDLKAADKPGTPVDSRPTTQTSKRTRPGTKQKKKTKK